MIEGLINYSQLLSVTGLLFNILGSMSIIYSSTRFVHYFPGYPEEINQLQHLQSYPSTIDQLSIGDDRFGALRNVIEDKTGYAPVCRVKTHLYEKDVFVPYGGAEFWVKDDEGNLTFGGDQSELDPGKYRIENIEFFILMNWVDSAIEDGKRATRKYIVLYGVLIILIGFLLQTLAEVSLL